MVAQADAQRGPERSLTVRASLAATPTLTLGWMTYERFLTKALELSTEEHNEVSERIMKLIDALWIVDLERISVLGE